MPYTLSKEDLIKIAKLKNLSNSQLKLISSIDYHTLEKIQQIYNNIPYDILEKIRVNSYKIDTVTLNLYKLNQAINNFKSQLLPNIDIKLLSELNNTFAKLNIIKNYSEIFNNISSKISNIKENKKEIEEEAIKVLTSISEDIEENLTDKDIEKFSSIDEFKSIEKEAKKYNKNLSIRDIIFLITVFFCLLFIFHKELIDYIFSLSKTYFGKAGIWVLDRQEYICLLTSLCVNNFIDKNSK